ncbi:MAG: hypothetical protein M0Z69_00750 [Actinomycetota bacterium]|nr:hypothetical protein [Actinomycetota bacterium]
MWLPGELQGAGDGERVIGHGTIDGSPATHLAGPVDLLLAARRLGEGGPAFAAGVPAASSIEAGTWIDSRHIVRSMELSLGELTGGGAVTTTTTSTSTTTTTVPSGSPGLPG